MSQSVRSTLAPVLAGAVLAVLVAAPAAARQTAPQPPATDGEPAAETAETAETAAAAEPVWEGSLGLSYLATSGNSDTQTVGADLGLERKPRPWGLSLKAAFNRNQEDGEKTAERYFAGVRALRSLSERWELFAGLSGERDEFSGIDLRAVVEAGGLYHLLTGPVHTLAFDAGLTWTDEDLLPPARDSESLGGVAGFKYGWKISEGATFGQRVLYYPNFDTSDDWRVESETALAAALSQRLALKVGYEVRYRNRPVGDNDDTDTTTKLSLVVKL